MLERASRGQDDLDGTQPSITPPARGNRTGHSTPKRPQAETAGMADIFPYYAGFSFNWASSILNDQIAKSGIESPLILDPWNGSGTTTAAPEKYNGYRSVGVDFNPSGEHCRKSASFLPAEKADGRTVPFPQSLKTP